jgi:hypothetical protein
MFFKARLHHAVPATTAQPTQRTQQRRQILHDLPPLGNIQTKPNQMSQNIR